jgi:murein L,D-transpeptidase YafK
MKLSKTIFGDEAFRKVYNHYKRLPPINKALFDAIATQFAILSNEERELLKSRKTQFKKALKTSLAQDALFFISVTSSTGDKNRVFKRHNTIELLIKQIISA